MLALSFGEMLLSGYGLDNASQFTEANTMLQYEQRGVWTWHIPFFYQIDIATMLITGHEEEFWTYFMEAECYNPIALSRQAIAEWTGLAKGPGGLRGILETYRAGLVNGELILMSAVLCALDRRGGKADADFVQARLIESLSLISCRCRL